MSDYVHGLPGEGMMYRQVHPNSKCESCLHYARSIALRGACTKGQQPASCGDGTMPVYGYAPLNGALPENGPGVGTVTNNWTTTGAPKMLGKDEPQLEILERRVGTVYDGMIKSMVEEQALFTRSNCSAHSSAHVGSAVGNYLSTPECSCVRVNIEPICKSVLQAMPQALTLHLDEETIEDFVMRAMERVLPTNDKPSPPSVYLPGVHSPTSPVRAGKKKDKLVKAADTKTEYHQAFDAAVSAASRLPEHAREYYGQVSDHPAAKALREAAKRHVAMGVKFGDYPGRAKAVKHHDAQAARFAGTPKGVAHEAVASAYQSHATKSESIDADGWNDLNKGPTNQPYLPDSVRWASREMHRNGIKIGADHPKAHAVRMAARDHVASDFNHFGHKDHAVHVAAHREMATTALGTHEQAAHDALAAAHMTYGQMKQHATYKVKKSTNRNAELYGDTKVGISNMNHEIANFARNAKRADKEARAARKNKKPVVQLVAKSDYDDHPSPHTIIHNAGKDAHAAYTKNNRGAGAAAGAWLAANTTYNDHPLMPGVVKDEQKQIRRRLPGTTSSGHFEMAKRHDEAKSALHVTSPEYFNHHFKGEAHAAEGRRLARKEGMSKGGVIEKSKSPPGFEDILAAGREAYTNHVRATNSEGGAVVRAHNAINAHPKMHEAVSHLQNKVRKYGMSPVEHASEAEMHREMATRHAPTSSVFLDHHLLAHAHERERAADAEKAMPKLKDPTVDFHQHADEAVHQHAQKVHAVVGMSGADPSSMKIGADPSVHSLHLAARRHAMAVSPAKSKDAAAKYHKRADAYGDSAHGVAARAIAHAYERADAQKSLKRRKHKA